MFFAPGREAGAFFCQARLGAVTVAASNFYCRTIENQTILATFVAQRGVVPCAAVDGRRGLGLIFYKSGQENKTTYNSSATRRFRERWVGHCRLTFYF